MDWNEAAQSQFDSTCLGCHCRNDAFGAKEYDKAILLCGTRQRIAKPFGQVDTNAMFNSALAYETKGDAAMAIQRYQECLALGYDKPEIYRYMASLQKKSGDLDGAIATTRTGRTKHAGNKDLILDEMSYLLETGRGEEAEKSVNEAIAADPENLMLYSILASMYDAKPNPKANAVCLVRVPGRVVLAVNACKALLQRHHIRGKRGDHARDARQIHTIIRATAVVDVVAHDAQPRGHVTEA